MSNGIHVGFYRSCDVRKTQQRADELSAHSCSTGRTGSTVTADDGNPATSRTRSRVITEPGQRQWEHRKGTDRSDCRQTTVEGRRTTRPKELVRQHTTLRLCTRGRCMDRPETLGWKTDLPDHEGNAPSDGGVNWRSPCWRRQACRAGLWAFSGLGQRDRRRGKSHGPQNHSDGAKSWVRCMASIGRQLCAQVVERVGVSAAAHTRDASWRKGSQRGPWKWLIGEAQNIFVVRQTMPKNIKREFLTVPTKFDETTEKLDIIVNEMMVDDGPVPMDLENVGTRDTKMTQNDTGTSNDMSYEDVSAVACKGYNAGKGAGKKGSNGSGTRHRGKGADEWPSGKRDDGGKKGGKKGSKGSIPDWHTDKDKESKGKGKGKGRARAHRSELSIQVGQQHWRRGWSNIIVGHWGWRRMLKNSRGWRRLTSKESGAGLRRAKSAHGEGEGELTRDQQFTISQRKTKTNRCRGGLNHLVSRSAAGTQWTWEKVTVVADSGAAENVMPRSMFPEIGSGKQRGPQMERDSRDQGERTSKSMGSKSCPSGPLRDLCSSRTWEGVWCKPPTSSRLGTTCASGRMRRISWTGRRRRSQCSERKGTCTSLICSWGCHPAWQRPSCTRQWRLMQVIKLQVEESQEGVTFDCNSSSFWRQE